MSKGTHHREFSSRFTHYVLYLIHTTWQNIENRPIIAPLLVTVDRISDVDLRLNSQKTSLTLRLLMSYITQDLSRRAASGRSPAEMVGSNPTGGKDICLL